MIKVGVIFYEILSTEKHKWWMGKKSSAPSLETVGDIFKFYSQVELTSLSCWKIPEKRQPGYKIWYHSRIRIHKTILE